MLLPPATCDQSLLISTVELDEEYNDPTVIRFRGDLMIYGSVGAAGTAWQGAAGIIEVEGVSDSLAITYCPFTDPDAEWAWHSFYSGVRGTDIAAFGNMHRIEIDGKAMRRLAAADSSLWFVIESAPDTLASVNYDWAVRFLMKG